MCGSPVAYLLAVFGYVGWIQSAQGRSVLAFFANIEGVSARLSLAFGSWFGIFVLWHAYGLIMYACDGSTRMNAFKVPFS